MAETAKPTGKAAAGKRGARKASTGAASTAAKKRADAAAKKAKAAGATGRRVGGARAVLRDSMIVARASQNVPWADIAREAGVTARTCQRIVEQAREVRSPLDDAPMEILEGLARSFNRSIGDYEAMAFAWADTNQTAALGAKKAADETRTKLVELMSRVGKLPSNLTLIRAEDELIRLQEDMQDFLLSVVSGERSPEDAVQYLHERFDQRQRAGLEP